MIDSRGARSHVTIISSSSLFADRYTQRERATRMGISYTGLGTAGMVGGFIAIGVQNINGAGGLLAWQWLFIIEGIPAVLFGIIVYFILPRFPTDAKFLTDVERDIAIR